MGSRKAASRIEPGPSSARVGVLASRPDARKIAALSIPELEARLTPESRRTALAMMDWIARSSQGGKEVGSIVQLLCERLVAAGVPLDRYVSSTTMVTADHDAIGRIWRPDGGVEERIYISPDEGDPEYLTSPFHEAATTGAWVDLWLPETPDERFGVVPQLKAEGLVHYICVPMQLTNSADAWLTFATKRATGFSEQDLLIIAFMLPVLMMRIDARVGWTTLDKLLRTYVGEEPHQAILAGRAKRGQTTVITAAMMVADLRDSTGHVAGVDATAAVQLFNDLFDCLVPDIEVCRGEVLKYLGDGLLAIFREEEGSPPAAERALAAAEAALAAVDSANAARPTRRPMEIGIALHYGEVAYGNIGSGSRLDFTVIGRDVALASRIAGMNGPLGLPLLMSGAFASHLAHELQSAGAHPARGFEDPVEVFRPKDALAATPA